MTTQNPGDPSYPANYQLKPGFHPPAHTGVIGMYLFLLALLMLFASGMLGYLIIRLSATSKLPLGSLHLPAALWFSTAIVIAASVTAQRAVREVRHERQESFRRWLNVTMWLAIGFVLVQTPSMVLLLQKQQQMKQQRLALYGLVFFLILLHAAHVIGGIVALALTSRGAARNKYDHEHYLPVKHMALYWHFLDGVWLVMFLTFLSLG